MRTMTNGEYLQSIIEKGWIDLKHKVGAAESAIVPAPGKWSPRQIIGHLIDSASNNHQRFVRANFQDDLVFPGYAQEAWVELHGYQDWDWEEMLELWSRYNLLIARMIDRIPSELLLRKNARHNLHQIAWKVVPEHQSATLDYFIKDYIGHLIHHIQQILPGFKID